MSDQDTQKQEPNLSKQQKPLSRVDEIKLSLPDWLKLQRKITSGAKNNQNGFTSATVELYLKLWGKVATHVTFLLLGVGLAIFWIYKTEAWMHLNKLGWCNPEPSLMTESRLPERFPPPLEPTEQEAKEYLMERIWQLENWGTNQILRHDAIREQCSKK